MSRDLQSNVKAIDNEEQKSEELKESDNLLKENLGSKKGIKQQIIEEIKARIKNRGL